MGRLVAIQGDIVIDDPTANGPEFPQVIVQFNTTVYSNGKLVAVKRSLVSPHDADLGNQHLTSSFSQVSNKVFAHKKGLVRFQDPSRCGHPVMIMQNQTVFSA